MRGGPPVPVVPKAVRVMPDPETAPVPPAEAPLLEAIGIVKRYGDFLANDGIDLDLCPREIHALLGENGAGKSTLVKVIYGLIQPNAGELRWMGRKVELAGPAQARAIIINIAGRPRIATRDSDNRPLRCPNG